MRVTTALQGSSETFTGSFRAGIIHVFSLIHPEITWENASEKTDSKLSSELGMTALRWVVYHQREPRSSEGMEVDVPQVLVDVMD